MVLEAYTAYDPRKTSSTKAIWTAFFDCRRSGEFHCFEIIYLLINATNGKKKDVFISLKLCVADIFYNDQFTYPTFSKFNSSVFSYQNLSPFVQRSRLRISLSRYWIGFQEDLWLIKRNLNWNSWSLCEYFYSIQTNKHKITFHFRMLEEHPTVTLFRNVGCTFTCYTFCRVGIVTVNIGLINSVFPYSSSRQCMLVVSTGTVWVMYTQTPLVFTEYFPYSPENSSQSNFLSGTQRWKYKPKNISKNTIPLKEWSVFVWRLHSCGCQALCV